ncbi:MAG: phosphohexomutase domain-containing protein [Gammaproteobacteria bacterium]
MSDAQAQCFKAYDIRGRVPGELDADLAARIGRAFAEYLDARSVVVGRDVRLSGPSFAQAVSAGLAAGGAEVLDLGMCGTEEIYHAVNHLGCDGGVMVTASHNPPDYNGFKLVRAGARPLSEDTGLKEIARRALSDRRGIPSGAVAVRPVSTRAAYVAQLLGCVTGPLRPLKLVANPGNGAAGPVLEQLFARLPVQVTWLYREPDGRFPNGVPNPLLPEHRKATARVVQQTGADFGLAWDGDFDRCFFFDEQGQFIEGYYLVGLFAGIFLRKYPGSKIIHDPRLVWNTIEMVARLGGIPIESKCGHAFIKERMRTEDAVYGGEMSAHHYFREFAYCDSGMIPWLLLLELLSSADVPLSQRVRARQDKFPVSGEINRSVADADAALRRVQERYAGEAERISSVDGISMELTDWRFNLRRSNTEPLLRLNVESRGDAPLVKRRTQEILALMDAPAARGSRA